MRRLIELIIQLLSRKPIGTGDDPGAVAMYETEPETIWRANFTEWQRMQAFLDMISYAEGTDRFGNDRGYDVIVGGSLMDNYDDHPRKSVRLPRYNINSTAAGRYQILSRYWDHYKAQLKLPDFGPESQDRYAIQQIKEQRALNDVMTGSIENAIVKCSNIWASFPGAGYGQREVKMGELLAYYNERYRELVK